MRRGEKLGVNDDKTNDYAEEKQKKEELARKKRSSNLTADEMVVDKKLLQRLANMEQRNNELVNVMIQLETKIR